MSKEVLIQSGLPSGSVVRKANVGIILGVQQTVPADGTAGYAPNAIFIDENAAGGQGLYVNTGTFLACTFRLVPAFANSYVLAGSTLTLTAAYAGQTIKLNTLTGSVVTLPAAAGTGIRFRFIISVVATSNSHKIQVANSSDTFQGIITAVSDGAGFPVLGYTADATAGADTITLNRTTTGGTVKGEWIEVEDFATNVWAVRGQIAETGAEATPFSAAV